MQWRSRDVVESGSVPRIESVDSITISDGISTKTERSGQGRGRIQSTVLTHTPQQVE